MKTNTIIIVVLILIIAALGITYARKKKEKGDSIDKFLKSIGLSKDEYAENIAAGIRQHGGDAGRPLPNKQGIIPHSGVMPPNSRNDKDFFTALGFGSNVTNMLSPSDATTARRYVEEYMRKGIKMLPTDPLYNDIVRIASYSSLFPKP